MFFANLRNISFPFSSFLHSFSFNQLKYVRGSQSYRHLLAEDHKMKCYWINLLVATFYSFANVFRINLINLFLPKTSQPWLVQIDLAHWHQSHDSLTYIHVLVISHAADLNFLIYMLVQHYLVGIGKSPRHQCTPINEESKDPFLRIFVRTHFAFNEYLIKPERSLMASMKALRTL